VLGSVGDRNPAPFGKGFHRPLALSDQLQKLKAVLVGERLSDNCKLRVERAFWVRA
jgi:hypothetical protein